MHFYLKLIAPNVSKEEAKHHDQHAPNTDEEKAA
jgi:hypothetical protein